MLIYKSSLPLASLACTVLWSYWWTTQKHLYYVRKVGRQHVGRQHASDFDPSMSTLKKDESSEPVLLLARKHRGKQQNFFSKSFQEKDGEAFNKPLYGLMVLKDKLGGLCIRLEPVVGTNQMKMSLSHAPWLKEN